MELSEIAHDGITWNVSWDPCWDIVCSCGSDKIINIWKFDRAKRSLKCNYKLIEGHDKAIRSISWSPCSNYIVSCGFDSIVNVWIKEETKFSLFTTLEGHENEVKCVAWSPCGKYIATCGRDRTVWVWEVSKFADDFDCCAVLSNHTQDVKKVIWHPTHLILLSCGYDDIINVYIKEDMEWLCVDTLKGHNNTVWSMDYNTQLNILVSCDSIGSIFLWDFINENDRKNSNYYFVFKQSWTNIHHGTIFDIKYWPLKNQYITVGSDNSVKITSATDGTILYAKEYNCEIVSLSIKEKYVVLGCDDGSIKLLEIE